MRLRVQASPNWRFTVDDDGRGFSPDGPPPDETHVGLRIMRERAERIGAALAVESVSGRGTRVTLTLPRTDLAAPAASPLEAAGHD